MAHLKIRQDQLRWTSAHSPNSTFSQSPSSPSGAIPWTPSSSSSCNTYSPVTDVQANTFKAVLKIDDKDACREVIIYVNDKDIIVKKKRRLTRREKVVFRVPLSTAQVSVIEDGWIRFDAAKPFVIKLQQDVENFLVNLMYRTAESEPDDEMFGGSPRVVVWDSTVNSPIKRRLSKLQREYSELDAHQIIDKESQSAKNHHQFSPMVIINKFASDGKVSLNNSKSDFKQDSDDEHTT
ncbi:lytic murein transglycosylase [Acrasis kona]|uniref:Lytic murein transglycosylase n=1 Tax=Acrasis kona TaxID=1008807 RepID=A0AAW2ZCP6_9EUKA